MNIKKKEADFCALAKTTLDYIWIVTRVVLVAFFGGLTWTTFQNLHHEATSHDAEVIQMVLMAEFFFFHTTMAASIMASVIKRYNMVRLAFLQGDREAFEIQRQIHLPGFLKFLLAVFSTVIVYWFARIHFDDWQTGFTAAFTLTLVLSLYWVVLTELDDPVNSPWFRHQAPPEWISPLVERVTEEALVVTTANG